MCWFCECVGVVCALVSVGIGGLGTLASELLGSVAPLIAGAQHDPALGIYRALVAEFGVVRVAVFAWIALLDDLTRRLWPAHPHAPVVVHRVADAHEIGAVRAYARFQQLVHPAWAAYHRRSKRMFAVRFTVSCRPARRRVPQRWLWARRHPGLIRFFRHAWARFWRRTIRCAAGCRTRRRAGGSARLGSRGSVITAIAASCKQQGSGAKCGEGCV